MKQFARHLALLAAVSLTLGACSSVPLDEQKAAPIDNRAAAGDASPSAQAAPEPAARSAIAPVQATSSATTGLPAALSDPSSPVFRKIVYFDFDSFEIREEFRGLIQAHANFLQTNKQLRVALQGHTDERGTREYNLALGQKRAEAVRKALVTLGVADSQLEAVSLGEEKPMNQGTDEAAYAQNRRAELVYQQ
ncbi:MAG: peptidoglycan-associated lipoprotein Pal [Betaproteobacteria bacterium]|jgi:peptidoglycan-associated lipoprotein|nr:peptidoglycan-associated lipoprotein Pal [Pseudomonadota bacterium]NBO04098.1 peptidoglycan-associated lipoprotein Pal [Betaproteobacteria bacterium]NBO94664.1 peptidoglycan-associated lipoprotein Pal [Betaproteobacteria bacterium]NBP34823.1 peptidoglycan-associated lipoprotein Pal [Betaproteobacteria bacterium]NBP37861.1 peptidoglycan-associated lipoprotein Pal [Betaproteobacteria bacterium]